MIEQKFPCFYPIFSLPPNIFHFNAAQILSHRDGVSSVIIIIPDIKYDYLNQEQAAQLFELYTAGSPVMDFTVERSKSHNPFQDIKDRFKKDEGLKAFIALDEKTARSSEFNEAFQAYNNLEVQLVPSNFDKTSDKMREAIEIGKKSEFIKYVPQALTPQQKDECWNIVHSEIQEQIVTIDYWRKILSEAFINKPDFFDLSTTGMPNYDAMIESPAYYYFFKDKHIQLEWMSSQKYMKLCAKYVHDTTVENEYKNINKTDVKAINILVDKGHKLETPILNIADKSQEGRHRSVVAHERGYDEIPVYVITPVDQTKKDKAKDIINESKTFEEAKTALEALEVPIDKMTYKKIKWKEFKEKTEPK